MRLRLRIERNALPPTQTLWPIKDPQTTIAQLLHAVDDTFPLEADNWGLEDYSVSVGGYECLHYHELQAVCKDEDEVVIRPLQWVDVRARKLTGRDQIASDGRHLLDGIPFGRPRVKAPVRPSISIPPRKRRKLLHEDTGDGTAEEQLLLEYREKEASSDDEEEEEDDEEEGDGDFDAGTSSAEETSSEEDSENSSDSEDSSSNEGSSDATDSESGGEKSSDGSRAMKPSSLGKKKSSDLPNGLSTAYPIDRPPTPSKRKRQLNPEDINEAYDNHTGSSLEVSNKVVLPYHGSTETKARNARRRDQRQLKRLKQDGVIPSDATLLTLRQWREQGGMLGAPDQNSSPTADDLTAEDSLMPQDNGVVAKKTMKAKKSLEDAEFEEKRQQLLSAIQAGGVDVTTDTSSHVPPSNDTPIQLTKPPKSLSHAVDISVDTTRDRAAAMPIESPTSHSRLNLAGSKRLIFGSLGVRVPKTQEERDALQQKLAQRPKMRSNPPASSPTNGITSAPDEDQTLNADEGDPDAWQAKIRLTAVECCDEDVTLSTPPFPFQQRWDPQYRKKTKAQRFSDAYINGNGKKRKRGGSNAEYAETYDKYNVNGYGDALEYDDEEDAEAYWEDGALLDGEEDCDEEEEESDAFPPLPADVDHLPTLTENQLMPKDFITFTELACDETTGWQPKMATRTAQVVGKVRDSGSWELRMSRRDTVPKAFDASGNRIYSKFEMPGLDADDEGSRMVLWDELGTVKLVLRFENHY